MSTIIGSSFQNRPAYRYIRTTDHLPSTRAAADAADPIARVKLFDPAGAWTWYVAGFDPDTGIAYGAVDGFEFEYGSFDMHELAAIRSRFGLPIERDLYWRPRPLSNMRRRYGE